jgi:hypothetical protein
VFYVDCARCEWIDGETISLATKCTINEVDVENGRFHTPVNILVEQECLMPELFEES